MRRCDLSARCSSSAFSGALPHLQGKGVLDTQLPPLPDNVRAVEHVNECYDWGTFGWVRSLVVSGVV